MQEEDERKRRLDFELLLEIANHLEQLELQFKAIPDHIWVGIRKLKLKQ